MAIEPISEKGPSSGPEPPESADDFTRVEKTLSVCHSSKFTNRIPAPITHFSQRLLHGTLNSAPNPRIIWRNFGKLVAIMLTSSTVTAARAPIPATRNDIAMR